MLKLRFLSAVLSLVMMFSLSSEAFALFTSRNPREADLGVLNQVQMNQKEADLAFSNTKLFIDDIEVIKAGSRSQNNVNLILHLDNNSFVDISKGQEAGGWIIDMPKGVEAFVAEDVERGSSVLKLGLKGVTSSDMNDFIIVALPNAVLTSNSEKTVKSKYFADAGWEILSPSYEYVSPLKIEEEGEEGDADEEIEEEEEFIDEISEQDVLEIKKDLVAAIKYRGGAYTEVDVGVNKFIPAAVWEEVYEYAADAGKTDLQLANVCLLFTSEDDIGRVDTRLYVPFLRLAESENGLNPVINHDQEDGRLRDVAALFKKEAGKEGQVISVENKEDFGADAGVVVMLDGKPSANRYKTLYEFNEEEGSFSKFEGNYEVDSSGYIHFFTRSGGYFVLG